MKPRIAGAAALAVLTTSLLGLAAAAAPNEDTQVIDPNQAQGSGQVVLEEGHVDIGPTLNTGEWAVELHDDTSSPSYWRQLDDVVLKVSDLALEQIPDSEEFSFLGLEPGSEAWVVPQVQKQGVIWIGWNTQEPGVLEALNMGATMQINAVEGPGEVTVFLQSGNFGAPTVLWTSLKDFPQETWIEINTHTHANWVFSEPGIYYVEVEFAGDLISQEAVSAKGVLRFAVGDQTNAEDAFGVAPIGVPNEDAAQSETGSAETQSDSVMPSGGSGDESGAATADSGLSTLIVVLVGALGIALVFAVVVIVLGTRRAKQRAKADFDESQEGSADHSEETK